MKTSLLPFADQSNSQDSTTGSDQASQKDLALLGGVLRQVKIIERKGRGKRTIFNVCYGIDFRTLLSTLYHIIFPKEMGIKYSTDNIWQRKVTLRFPGEIIALFSRC